MKNIHYELKISVEECSRIYDWSDGFYFSIVSVTLLQINFAYITSTPFFESFVMTYIFVING